MGPIIVKWSCNCWSYNRHYHLIYPCNPVSSPQCNVMADMGKVSISAQGWAQSLGFKIPQK